MENSESNLGLIVAALLLILFISSVAIAYEHQESIKPIKIGDTVSIPNGKGVVISENYDHYTVRIELNSTYSEARFLKSEVFKIKP